jgi:hypothetical protein
MLVLGCGLGLAVMVLVGVWLDGGLVGVLGGPSSSPAVGEAEPPMIYSGVGSQSTAPFYLPGGSYRGQWSAWGQTPDDPPCTHSAELLATDSAGKQVLQLASLVQVPATGATRQTEAVRLEAGYYALDVRSACAWQISLQPAASFQ